MRSFFLALLLILTCGLAGSRSAAAQGTTPAATARPAANRLALASITTPPASRPSAAAPARVVCSRLDGQVLGLDGKPLVGATVTVKGTHNLFTTNADGRYLVEVPVYQGQILEIEAAGYTTREVVLTDCTAPVVSLELAAGTRVKKNGKRAGQIVRFGPADMQ